MFKKLTILLLVLSTILGTAVAMANDEDGETDLDADTSETVHELIGSEWRLSVLKTETAILEVLVTIKFDEDGRVYGTGGCNRFNGTYTIDGDEITFGPIASTRMRCAQDNISEQEHAFLTALETITHYELITKDALYLKSDDEITLEFFRFPSLIGTQWELITLNRDGLVENTKITLAFDDEGNAYGSSGCNSYTGSYEFSGGHLSFGMMASTLMACLDEGVMEQEMLYSQVLSEVDRYVIGDNFQMRLYTPDGGELIFEQVHELLGTAWQLDSIAGEAIPEDVAVNLIFEQFDHAYGSACNVYNAFYEVLGDGEIIFGIVVSTMMLCQDPLMAVENAYTGALYGAYGYEVNDEQLIIHYLADGEEFELIFSSYVPTTE